MTDMERIMLCVCFGGMMGVIIGNLGFLVSEWIRHIKMKRSEKKKQNKE